LNKKKNAIVISLSENILFSAGTLIINCEEKMPGIVDEYVLIHEGIKESDKKVISGLAQVRFIYYDKPDCFFEKVDKLIINQFSRLVFAKFECLKLLNDYNNIIMTDTDVVIYEDISELFARKKSSLKFLFNDGSVLEQFKCSVDGYDMTKKGMSAGIIVFHDDLDKYEEMYDFCYRSLQDYGEYIKMPEQAIFDLMVQDFNVSPDHIDGRVYCRLPKDAGLDDDFKILHSAGQPKFWSGLKNKDWNRYYRTWLALGGSSFNKTKLLINIIVPVGSLRRKMIQKLYHYLQ